MKKEEKNMRFKVIVNYISFKDYYIKLNEWNYNRSSKKSLYNLIKNIIIRYHSPPKKKKKNYFPPDISRALYNEARRQ